MCIIVYNYIQVYYDLSVQNTRKYTYFYIYFKDYVFVFLHRFIIMSICRTGGIEIRYHPSGILVYLKCRKLRCYFA